MNVWNTFNQVNDLFDNYTDDKNDSVELDYKKDLLIEEKCFNIKDGKLRKNVSKTKGPLKKQIIHQALVDITGDSNKATAMTEHIINSRPIIERVNLKRTKKRGPRKK